LVNHGSLRSKWAYELLLAGKRVVQEIPKVEWPYLICTGTQDFIVDAEGSKLFHEKSSSKDKKIIIYEGLYHEILNEPEREV
jgi:acylglycerol lipase